MKKGFKFKCKAKDLLDILKDLEKEFKILIGGDNNEQINSNPNG